MVGRVDPCTANSELLSQELSECLVERVDLGLFSASESVGGIADGRIKSNARATVAEVSMFEFNGSLREMPGANLFEGSESALVDFDSEKPHALRIPLALLQSASLRIVGLLVVIVEGFKAEAPVQVRCDSSGHHPGLEEQGARPAHWVDERGTAVPSGQGEESGSQILLHGSLSMLDPVSSLEEGGAGHVEGQGSPVLLEVDHHMNIRVTFFDRGTDTATKFTKGVGDSILHPVDRIAGVRDLGRVPLDVDAKPCVYGKEFMPVGLAGLVVEQVIVTGIEATNGAQDIEGRAQSHVGPVKPGQIGHDFDCSLAGFHDFDFEVLEFLCHNFFQTAAAEDKPRQAFRIGRSCGGGHFTVLWSVEFTASGRIPVL